jgi:hypothetical protein
MACAHVKRLRRNSRHLPAKALGRGRELRLQGMLLHQLLHAQHASRLLPGCRDGATRAYETDALIRNLFTHLPWR